MKSMADLPNWPAMLSRQLASQYCGLSPSQFDRQVLAGVLPEAIELGGVDRWSRSKLDQALAIISGDEPKDWRTDSPLYAGGQS